MQIKSHYGMVLQPTSAYVSDISEIQDSLNTHSIHTYDSPRRLVSILKN